MIPYFNVKDDLRAQARMTVSIDRNEGMTGRLRLFDIRSGSMEGCQCLGSDGRGARSQEARLTAGCWGATAPLHTPLPSKWNVLVPVSDTGYEEVEGSRPANRKRWATTRRLIDAEEVFFSTKFRRCWGSAWCAWRTVGEKIVALTQRRRFSSSLGCWRRRSAVELNHVVMKASVNVKEASTDDIQHASRVRDAVLKACVSNLIHNEHSE